MVPASRQQAHRPFVRDQERASQQLLRGGPSMIYYVDRNGVVHFLPPRRK